MVNMTISFIGGGNMATAMISGILRAKIAEPDDIYVSAPTEETRNRMMTNFSVHTTADNREAAKNADVLVLAVKPNIYEQVISEISEYVSRDTLVISIAAGQSLRAVREMFGRNLRIIRVMPNTPALVGEAMSAMCPGEKVTDDDTAVAMKIFSSFGRVEIIPERLMDAVTGVSGSSPAFVYMFIEAMADAAVEAGMQRSQAYTFAAQSVLGAAKMVLDTKKHPGELKDQVTSPAGTTIAGVAALEADGFRGDVMDGVLAAVEKSREMSRK